MYPVIFRVGFFALHWYGVIITTAIILGLLLAKKELRRKGMKYEFILNSFIFLIVWNLRKKSLPQGFLFLIYASLYSFIRIIVEVFRADKLYFMYDIPAAQALGIVVIITSLTLMVFLKKKSKISVILERNAQ